MEYRVEQKYIVDESDIVLLKNRLNNLIKLDDHIGEKGYYNIRSIYFDDYNNSCYHETEDGLNERSKIRIRIYDRSDKLIHLEIKYKVNGLTKKESCKISKELCLKLMNGERLDISECTNKVLRRVYLEQNMYMLKPKVIVEYDRIAYVSKIGNVRITFDKNIRASKHIDRFFEDNLYAHPILEVGNHVLEVKYDELIPDYIMDAIQINKLERTAFSKYYLSRLALKEEVK